MHKDLRYPQYLSTSIIVRVKGRVAFAAPSSDKHRPAEPFGDFDDATQISGQVAT
jgi:hypothetical protein